MTLSLSIFSKVTAAKYWLLFYKAQILRKISIVNKVELFGVTSQSASSWLTLILENSIKYKIIEIGLRVLFFCFVRYCWTNDYENDYVILHKMCKQIVKVPSYRKEGNKRIILRLLLCASIWFLKDLNKFSNIFLHLDSRTLINCFISSFFFFFFF